MTHSVVTTSQQETEAVGRELAASLRRGSVVLLFGNLGAGKTALVRGLAEGLGADPGEVSSPTFTLIQEYRGGREPLAHVDLYRLNDAREVADLGLEELLDSHVVVVEWAEKWPLAPAGSSRVTLEDLGADRRRITVHSDR